MTNGRSILINLTTVRRVILDGRFVQFVYDTKNTYSYGFRDEFKSGKFYVDIQLAMAKNGQLVDTDGMMK